LSIHFEDSHFSAFDFSLQPILYKMVPFENIKIFSYLINNNQVTALFLAKYFAIKFYTGHTFRDIVNPVVKDLKRIVVRTLYLFHKLLHVNVEKMSRFLNYRSFFFKRFLFKNFLIFKIFSVRFFFSRSSFFNFYIL
jgi:hypothetical protein